MKVLEHSTVARPEQAVRPFRIAVATNGDDDSLGAVALAAKLCDDHDAAVLAVAAVQHSPPLFPAGRSTSSIDDESRCEVPDNVQHVLSTVPTATAWTRRAFRGWPADVVNEAAATFDAALIIVGLGHHRAIDRLFGTETAINVIKHAAIPVLAVPSYTRDLPRHACAAIDFTDASTAAALHAASLLSRNGDLTLLHVSPYSGVEAETDPVAQLYLDAAGKKLAEVLAFVRRRTPNQVDGMIVDGEPTRAILDFIRTESCDLVALGGHAQGLVDRILIGSVRTRVLRAAGCSVLVAPPEGVGGWP